MNEYAVGYQLTSNVRNDSSVHSLLWFIFCMEFLYRLSCFFPYFFIIGVQIFMQWALHHASMYYVSLRHYLALENFRNQCPHAVLTGRYCLLCIIPEHALSLFEVQISERIECHISPMKRPNWRFSQFYSTCVEYQPHWSLTISLPGS